VGKFFFLLSRNIYYDFSGGPAQGTSSQGICKFCTYAATIKPTWASILNLGYANRIVFYLGDRPILKG